MTPGEIVAICGFGFTALCAVVAAGVAWGSLRTAQASNEEKFRKFEAKCDRYDETLHSQNLDVLRTDIAGLRMYLASRFDEFDRRLSDVEHKQ